MRAGLRMVAVYWVLGTGRAGHHSRVDPIDDRRAQVRFTCTDGVWTDLGVSECYSEVIQR